MARNATSRDRFLRRILILSILVAMALISYDTFFIAPSFTALLIDATKNDAVRIGRHLASSMLISEKDEIGKGSLNSQLLLGSEIEQLKEDFQMMNLKVFSPTGEIIFSADPTEIGTRNDNAYFHEIVAKGRVHAKVVPKDSNSLEGRKVTSDVLETYVPLMNNGKFLGVFEVYYDITERKKQLSRLISQSSTLILVFALGLVIAIVFMLYQENTARKRRRQLEEERLKREKLEGVLEMAGAACHELSQPLQAMSAYCNKLLDDLPEDSPPLGDINEIKKKIEQLGQITRKIMHITRYETKEYGADRRIIDIDKASSGA
jgi:hypothetical protein